MIYEIGDKFQKEASKISDEYEIYISNFKSIELDSKKDELNFAKEEIETGAGIRIIKDNKIGFAFTTDFDKIPQTVSKALANSKLNKEDKNSAFAEPGNIPEVKKINDKKFNDWSVEDYIEYVKNTINQVNDSECSLTGAGFSANRAQTLIINSNDVSISSEETSYGIGVSVMLEKDAQIATAYNSQSSRFFDINSEKLTGEVIKLATDSIDTKSVETGDYDVVLDYYAATGLLSVFLQAFDGDNVLRQKSVLKDKMGEKIANPNLSIVDNPLLEKGLASGGFDSEATPSKQTTLVENGVLKSFLYDIYTANKASVESTSNGYRSTYMTTPDISQSNVVFDFKDKKAIDEINSGVLTTSVLGAHTANPITGDFSVEASNAFKIENGEITTPINKAMISGNIFELVKTCEGLDTEIRQYGSFILPKILVHNLRVIGN